MDPPYKLCVTLDMTSLLVSCDLCCLCLILCNYWHCLRYNKTNSYWRYWWVFKILSPQFWIFPSAFSLGEYSQLSILNMHLTVSNYLYIIIIIVMPMCTPGWIQNHLLTSFTLSTSMALLEVQLVHINFTYCGSKVAYRQSLVQRFQACILPSFSLPLLSMWSVSCNGGTVKYFMVLCARIYVPY